MLAIRNRSVVVGRLGLRERVRSPIAAVWTISPSTLRANEAAVEPPPTIRWRRYASVAAQPVSGASVVDVVDVGDVVVLDGFDGFGSFGSFGSVAVVGGRVEVTSLVRSPTGGGATGGLAASRSPAAGGSPAEAARESI